MLSARAKLRIYLIDDHPVVREGFARALSAEPDLEVVGGASTAAEAREGAPGARPDVVLVDLALPDGDGSALLGALRAALPEARLVVVSAYDDEYRVSEAVRAGAHGYLLKTSTLEQLVDGIRAVAQGDTPLSPELHGVVMRAVRKRGRAGAGTIDALTVREREVLRLFATGLPTREVAASLGISPKTVETHRLRIYDKLGCKSVVELTRLAVRVGLIQA